MPAGRGRAGGKYFRRVMQFCGGLRVTVWRGDDGRPPRLFGKQLPALRRVGILQKRRGLPRPVRNEASAAAAVFARIAPEAPGGGGQGGQLKRRVAHHSKRSLPKRSCKSRSGVARRAQLSKIYCDVLTRISRGVGESPRR